MPLTLHLRSTRADQDVNANGTLGQEASAEQLLPPESHLKRSDYLGHYKPFEQAPKNKLHLKKRK